MAKFRMVNTRFWEDNYIARLDPTEKLLYLYLITNPHSTLSGIYELPLRLMGAETGIDTEMIQNLFDRFDKDGKLRYQDGWVAMKNFKKHHMGGGKDFQAGIEKDLKSAPLWAISFVGGESLDSPPTVSALASALASAPISVAKAPDLHISMDEDDNPRKTYVRKAPDDNANLIVEEREKKMGRKFTNFKAQSGKVRLMLDLGYTKAQIIEEYEYLEKEKFWGKNGVDFLIVASNIHKEHD